MPIRAAALLDAMILTLLLLPVGSARAASPEADVQSTLKKFVAAFNDGFANPADEYAALDWNHIAPDGERTQGRETTLKRIRELHQGFLKGAKEEVESVDVKFPARDVAVATAVSLYTLVRPPTQSMPRTQRGIRTFVLVRRSGRWLIVQDQNTPIPVQSR